MSQDNHLFKKAKWRNLFLYQFVVPTGIIFLTAILIGSTNNNISKVLIEFVFSGELNLISIFLIIGTGLESPKPQNRSNGLNILGLKLFDLWIPIVIFGMLIYMANKILVAQCGQCVVTNSLTWNDYAFIILNISMLLAAPIYCFQTVKESTSK